MPVFFGLSSSSVSLPDRDFQIIDRIEFSKAFRMAISEAEKRIDCLIDGKTMKFLIETISDTEQKLRQIRNYPHNVKLRCITEITRANLNECKELMKIFEVYNIASLKGNFVLIDNREYLGYLQNESGGERFLHSTNPSFVDSQRFMINALFMSAMPAQQRILEIGRASGNEITETISDPRRLKSKLVEMIQSAVYEIAVLFSTKNSFLVAEREGILAELQLISKNITKVKILVMQDEEVKEISTSKLKMLDQNIQVNYLQHFLPTKIIMLIVDQTMSITSEIKADTEEGFHTAIGSSTLSNSGSTVFSNISIFDSLWIQAELAKQAQARKAYFQVFRGLKLKDEVYNKTWTNSNSESPPSTLLPHSPAKSDDHKS